MVVLCGGAGDAVEMGVTRWMIELFLVIFLVIGVPVILILGCGNGPDKSKPAVRAKPRRTKKAD